VGQSSAPDHRSSTSLRSQYQTRPDSPWWMARCPARYSGRSSGQARALSPAGPDVRGARPRRLHWSPRRTAGR
jgi:hypothetical protein